MSTFRCRWFAAAGAIVAASVTYAVHAQPRTLADCRVIAADAERLACYDAVSGRTQIGRAHV